MSPIIKFVTDESFNERIYNYSMLYTDGIHLASDVSLDELHDFAKNKMGLSRGYFHSHERHPHYDLKSKRVRELAKSLGVPFLSKRELTELMWKSGIWIPNSKETL